MRCALTLAAICTGACSGNSGAPQIPDGGPADAAPIDAWTMCPSDASFPVCDLFLSCGCNTPVDKCSAGDNGPSCFTAGALAAGEVCTTETDCVAGTTCAPYFGTAVCMKFCDGQHPCPSAEACYIDVQDRQVPPQLIGHACGQACSLLGQDCIYGGQGCYYNPRLKDLSDGEGECVGAGAAVQGQSCVAANDCAAGFICVSGSGSSSPICAKLCDRTGADPKCDSGSCQPLMGETKTGICLP
jgi:hypothetical protein